MIGIERLRQLVAEAAKRREEIEAALLELEESARELTTTRRTRDATAD